MLKRNIIWFQVDSLRPEFLDTSTNESDNKTFLDKLVSKGDFFSNCISAAPYTIASEISIFTGLYPHVHGVDGWFKTSPESIKKNIITFTDILKDEGYYSTCIYESAVRAYVPPYSFDEYHMLEPGIRFPLDKFGNCKTNKFLFCQFSGIHDDCIRLKGKYTKGDYRKSLEKISEKIEILYNSLCGESDIIIIASDHGVRCVDELEGDHRENVTGRYLTDKTIKACFSILTKESLEKFTIHDDLVRTLDIVPTILDLANLKPLRAQGVSLKSIICDEQVPNKIPIPKHVISQTGGMLTSPWVPDTWSVRTKDWKYVLTKLESKEGKSFKKELYNLVEDEFEVNNLYGIDNGIAKELQTILDVEVFDYKVDILDFYKDNLEEHRQILKSRTYPLVLKMKITYKNFLYRNISRSKLRVKLFLKKIYIQYFGN
jgi:arylsulfatase A-like enzyme